MKNLRGAGHLAEPVRQLATGVAVLKLERQPYLLAYQFLSQDGFKMHQKPFSAWESLQRSRRPPSRMERGHPSPRRIRRLDPRRLRRLGPGI